jgi:hypothetical protein
MSLQLRAIAAPWVLTALCLAAPIAAQVPPAARDTIPADTMPQLPQQDTAAADTLRPAVPFPSMPIAPAVLQAGMEWVWTRDALLREAPASLTDLLARIPGITALRAGMFAQPEAASLFGMTAGRMEIEIDGYVLDPLAAATFDLAQLPLGQIRELRVERRIGLLRIRIFSEAPEAAQPLTRVEAGIGLPPANMFRGVFLVPHVIVGPLGLSVERLDTDGIGRREPANVFSGWGKWGWTDGTRGIQLELWRSTLRRLPNSPWPLNRSRQDLIVRARNTFAPGLVGEVYAGRSLMDERVPRPAGDTTPEFRVERRSAQAGARAAYQFEQGTIVGALRYRSAAFLPSLEGVLRADGGTGPVRVGGEIGYATWREHDATTFFAANGSLALVGGLSAFGEITGGRRGAPQLDELTAGATVAERSGWRAGLAAALGTRATGSIAAVGFEQDQSVPFGLPFDTLGSPLTAEPIRGFEAYGRVVLLPRFFTLESWITQWQTPAVESWLYLPPRTWRTSLELHTLPLRSGNLEILGRLEAAQRGGINTWYRPDPEEPAVLLALPAHTRANAYLQIRVLDVRAFIRWDDILGRDGFEELPGRIHRGPRIFYGVKWLLWN